MNDGLFKDQMRLIGNVAGAIAAGDRTYCGLLDTLPAAIYITDAEGRITFFNRACVAFTGREPRLGDKWCVTWRLRWPDGTHMRHDECPMAIALREDRPVRGAEAIAERPDGSRIAFMPYPTPLHDANGRLIGAINMLVDITERKRLEQATQQTNAKLERGIADRTRALIEAFENLRDSERRFRLLIDGVTDCAIFMLDHDGIVISWNPGAARIKGYKEDEIIGQHFSVFYTPEDQAAGVPQQALEIAARHGKYLNEGWRLRRDGTRFWASVVINALHDETGALIGFAKVTRDFTERRTAEQALIESERLARGIVDTALDAFIQMDERGLIREWNSRAEAIFGWTREEALGRHYADLILPSEERTRHADGLAALLRSVGDEPDHRLQFRALRRDGRRVSVEFTISGMPRDGSAIYNAFARDLTAKLATDAQLRQAQKMEAIGQLTGGIAHDFNNLLAVIVPNIELSKLRLADPTALKYLDDALGAADRGAALTRRLLSFARKQELMMGPVDVRRLIAEACEMLPRTLGPAIRIETRIAPDAWSVMSDSGQLELVLLNLAINARDAMPEGGILTFAAANSPADTGRKPARLSNTDCVEITVADTGCGMSEEVCLHAFEPFFTTKAA
ncbi:MAG: PAS domain S-box protein, partial [Xanthobacteraceae bacterium]